MLMYSFLCRYWAAQVCSQPDFSILHNLALKTIMSNVALLDSDETGEAFVNRNDSPIYDSYHRDFDVAIDKHSYAILLRMLENLQFIQEYHSGIHF